MIVKKFQAPNYKFRINHNVQNSKRFDIEIWNLFGTWCFEFEISSFCFSPSLYYNFCAIGNAVTYSALEMSVVTDGIYSTNGAMIESPARITDTDGMSCLILDSKTELKWAAEIYALDTGANIPSLEIMFEMPRAQSGRTLSSTDLVF